MKTRAQKGRKNVYPPGLGASGLTAGSGFPLLCSGAAKARPGAYRFNPLRVPRGRLFPPRLKTAFRAFAFFIDSR
jgi:hypothetical protein